MSKDDGCQSRCCSRSATGYHRMGVVLRTWAPASEGRRNQGACLEMQAGPPESQLLIRSKIDFYRDGERVICSKIRQFGLLVQSLGDGSLAEKGGCQLETAAAKYRSQVAVYRRWRSL